MPKVTLEFSLPEEREEFDFADKGWQAHNIVEEMDNYLRSKIKYNDLSDVEQAVFQQVRAKLWELRRGE